MGNQPYTLMTVVRAQQIVGRNHTFRDFSRRRAKKQQQIGQSPQQSGEQCARRHAALDVIEQQQHPFDQQRQKAHGQQRALPPGQQQYGRQQEAHCGQQHAHPLHIPDSPIRKLLIFNQLIIIVVEIIPIIPIIQGRPVIHFLLVIFDLFLIESLIVKNGPAIVKSQNQE